MTRGAVTGGAVTGGAVTGAAVIGAVVVAGGTVAVVVGATVVVGAIAMVVFAGAEAVETVVTGCGLAAIDPQPAVPTRVRLTASTATSLRTAYIRGPSGPSRLMTVFRHNTVNIRAELIFSCAIARWTRLWPSLLGPTYGTRRS